MTLIKPLIKTVINSLVATTAFAISITSAQANDTLSPSQAMPQHAQQASPTPQSYGTAQPLGTAQPRDFDAVNANYRIRYNNNLSAGRATITINSEGEHYEARFSLSHALLDTSQQAQFKLNQCRITPGQYHSTNKPTLKRSTTEQIHFDWSQQVAFFEGKEGSQRFSLAEPLYDPMSFFFAARCDLMAGKTEFTHPLIYRGKQSAHHYKVTGRTTIDTGIGEIEALVVQRQRRNPERRTTFYVAPSLGYMLVAIEHRENRMAQIRLTLDSINYRMR